MKDTKSQSKLAARAITIELDQAAKKAAAAAGVPLIEGYALVMAQRDGRVEPEPAWVAPSQTLQRLGLARPW